MNAITTSLPFPALPAALDFDPVREQATRNGVPVDGRYWVVNPLTDTVIGDGKSVHKVENFSKMWNAMWEGLSASTLDLSDAKVDARVIGNGAAMRAVIELPRHDFTRQLGEAAKMRIVVADSHDQSVKRRVDAQVLRLACLNGMVAVRESIGFSQRHTTFNDPEIIGTVASGWVGQLESEAEGMQSMTKVAVSEDTAIMFYRHNVARYRTATGWKFNERMLERIVAIHRSYQLGNNAYRVYNTLTHISTHVDEARNGADTGRKLLRIEQDIEQVVRGPFARLLDGELVTYGT